MIDLHCHILPVIDDGPRTMEGSLRMATMAVEQGIHTVIATPHHGTRGYSNKAITIRRRVQQLNAELNRHSIPLTVLPGQEFHLTKAYDKEYRKGRLQTLAGSPYLLVELPSRTIPTFLNEFLSYMERQQRRVIIAHPERNATVIQNPDLLFEWLKRDVLLQITTQSLVGYFGRSIQKTAFYLCENRLAHLIASDAHDPFRRSYYFQEAKAVVEQVGGVSLWQTFQTNAVDLLTNRDISALPSFSSQSRKLEQN